MKINGDYTFNAPIEVVYDLLQDPEALARAMPGTKELKATGPDSYDAELNVKIGPIKGSFGGSILIEEAERPTHFKLSVNGKGAAGNLSGAGTIDLQEVGVNQTRIDYAGETQVGGRIAQVGQRLVQSVARKMINKGLKSLEKDLAAQEAARHTAGEGANSTSI